MKDVVLTLWSKATFRRALYGFSVLSFFGSGIAQWQPAFLIRSFGLGTGEIGTWLTAIYGLGGLLGTFLGGQWATRYASNDEGLQMKGIALACCGTGAVSCLLYLSPNYYAAFAFMALTAVTFAVISGPLFATLQSLVPPHMRAVSISFLYLCANLIGMGLGPLAVGTLSDFLRPFAADESLRYSLLLASPGYLWAAWHLWRAGQNVAHDLHAS